MMNLIIIEIRLWLLLLYFSKKNLTSMINVGDLSHKICNKSATNLQNTGKTIILNLTGVTSLSEISTANVTYRMRSSPHDEIFDHEQGPLLIYKQAVVKKYGAIFFCYTLYGPSFFNTLWSIRASTYSYFQTMNFKGGNYRNHIISIILTIGRVYSLIFDSFFFQLFLVKQCQNVLQLGRISFSRFKWSKME